MIERPDNTNERAEQTASAAARTGELDDGLLVCDRCSSRLMYPAGCEARGREQWYIELKCPNCGGGRSGLFTVEMLDALDCELDRAEDEIATDLARMTSGNMVDYVARFVAALNADAIEPEDFRPRIT